MNRIKNYAELKASIVNWIKDYADQNKINTLVVGVSGGIDSAVVSTLCAETGLTDDLFALIVGLHSFLTCAN